MEVKKKSLVTLVQMKFIIVVLSILLTVFIPYGESYGSGAPASKPICSSMVPGHLGSPKTSPIPYAIKVDQNSVNGGDLITVTLMSTGNAQFKGFLAMGRKKDFKNDRMPQGRMIELKSAPAMAKVTSCSDVESSSVTHRNNDEKREVQFQWEAPNNVDGEYVIVATFVESFSDYWTEHPSEVIRVKRNANLQAVTTTKPPKVLSEATRAALDRLYAGCGETAGCFGVPPKCVESKSCDMIVNFQLDGQNGVKFMLGSETTEGAGRPFVAVGLSKDANMGDDSIFACQHTGTGGVVLEYYSAGRSPPLTHKGSEVHNAVTTLQDGFLTCDFNVKATNNVIDLPTGTSYNILNDRVHILLARGPSSEEGGGLSYHPSGADRAAAGQAVKLSDTAILGSKSQILIQLHGAFMIMAWLLCASTGMFTARYFKQTHVDVMPCGVKFWFAIHRSVMALTVLMSLTASVLIFVEIKGYTEAPEGAIAEYYHPILGIVLSSLAILQVLIAFCRPLPNARNRYIFNWVHWIIGNTAHILGIACIFLANDLAKSNLQGQPRYWGVLTAFIVFHVCLHIVMSVHTLKADKQMEIQNKKRAVLPGPMKNNPNSADVEAPGTGFRSAMLVLYMLVAAATAAALIYFVVSGLNEI